MRYEWLMPGFSKDLDAQVAGERMEALIEKHDGYVTPDEVLADGRKTNSPFHDFFEWDESAAAEKWRRKQARALVSNIGAKGSNRSAFPIVTNVKHGRHTYVNIRTAMANADMKAQVIQRSLLPLQRWITTYGGRREMSFVKGRVQQLRDRIEAEMMSAAGLR